MKINNKNNCFLGPTLEIPSEDFGVSDLGSPQNRAGEPPKAPRKQLFLLFLLSFLLFVPQLSSADTKLTAIRYGDYQDKLRIVFDLTSMPTIEIGTSENFIKLSLDRTTISESVQNVIELTDEVISFIAAEPWADKLNIGIFLRYPIKTSYFVAYAPPRLVIDVGKDFTRIYNYQNLAKGMDLLEIERGMPKGVAEAHALIIDPKYFSVRPALAATELGANVIDSVGTFFGSILSGGEKNIIGFSKAKTSRMMKREKAVAGINGTYFAPDGRPLGILMINKNLISLPVYDRTSLAITQKGRFFIDNFLSDNYIIMGESNKETKRFEINRFNESRGDNGLTLFTPVYGATTGTDNSGIELTIEDGEITHIQPGNSPIPEEGFVVSATGKAQSALMDFAQESMPIKINLNLAAYSIPPLVDDEVIHLLAGGPRLIKDGQPYVSKQSEYFKKDIAQSRAARSAIGITPDGKLILIAVDGPQRKKKSRGITGTEKSIGMTLEELSELFSYLGATDAMNLDGGSSSTLVVQSQVINNPVLGSEAVVSNSLLVFPKQR